MATYVSPMIEEIADYTDSTQGFFGGWGDAFGGNYYSRGWYYYYW